VYDRIVMYSKSESPEILKKLLGRDSWKLCKKQVKKKSRICITSWIF
jgi:hypothetical protein